MLFSEEVKLVDPCVDDACFGGIVVRIEVEIILVFIEQSACFGLMFRLVEYSFQQRSLAFCVHFCMFEDGC